MNQSARRRRMKVGLVWILWIANLAVIIGFWVQGNLALLGESGLNLIAVARLSGLIATFCVLTQFVVMGRQGWLEPLFGLDKLAVFHRRNGTFALSLILLHPLLMVTGYSILSDSDLITQYLVLSTFPFVSWAGWAVFLFVMTVGASIYIVRKHLKFESWYAVHLFNYIAVFLVVWHQLANGSDFLGSEVFRNYWIALYVFALANILIWRWGRPVLKMLIHRFEVEKVERETPTATSVYISGQNMQRFAARGGQFVMVRFLTKRLWMQEHPFSISMLPTDGHFRLTIRTLGDFTNDVPHIKKGVKVMVSGPHGAFTHDKQVTKKVLYIAGGIGITPIRAMIQERAGWSKPGDAVLLYGNRTVQDTVLLDELKKLALQINMPFHNVLSEQTGYKGETGFIDGEKIKRLVPDVAKRDVFLCGPPPMMEAVRSDLKTMGVPAEQIHYERFSLHKG